MIGGICLSVSLVCLVVGAEDYDKSIHLMFVKLCRIMGLWRGNKKDQILNQNGVRNCRDHLVRAACGGATCECFSK